MNAGLIFFRLTRFLRYLVIARGRLGHGLHSPFVFDLVTRVFRNQTDPDTVLKIERVRKRMLADSRMVEITYPGTINLKNKFRKMSAIARTSPVPAKYGKLLAGMAKEFGGPQIVEFGTSMGISTMYLASPDSAVPVYSMERCIPLAKIAAENFRDEAIDNISLFTGDFEEGIKNITRLGIRPGLVFIDGNHRKEPLLHYFGRMTELSGNDTVIVIDDINYSREMSEAWNIIRQNEKVTLTIDVFRMGIVFFRKGLTRSSYVIRY
jgi:predicted O-methyltransferase YrrM